MPKRLFLSKDITRSTQPEDRNLILCKSQGVLGKKLRQYIVMLSVFFLLNVHYFEFLSTTYKKK